MMRTYVRRYESYDTKLSLAFFFEWSSNHRYLHSFPTRRSSDLCLQCQLRLCTCSPLSMRVRGLGNDTFGRAGRSEEHTSELQSQSNLVCRLLLEKKKSRTYCRFWLNRYTVRRQASLAAASSYRG